MAVMGDAGLETELAGEVCAWPCVSMEGFEGGPLCMDIVLKNI